MKPCQSRCQIDLQNGIHFSTTLSREPGPEARTIRFDSSIRSDSIRERDPGRAVREAWTGPGLSLFLVFPMVFLVFLNFFVQFGSIDALEH